MGSFGLLRQGVTWAVLVGSLLPSDCLPAPTSTAEAEDTAQGRREEQAGHKPRDQTDAVPTEGSSAARPRAGSAG